MKIFFDMDGVLAKWDSVGPDVYTAPGYFQGRPAEHRIVSAARKLIREGYNVRIASKYMFEYMKEEKNRWLDLHFADDASVECLLSKESRVFIPYDQAKSELVDFRDSILIDDFNQNLFDCQEQGGISIKFLNGINGGSGEWTGYTLDCRSSSDSMVDTIKAIAMFEAERSIA